MQNQENVNASLVMFYQPGEEEKGESGVPGSPNHHHLSSQVDGSTGGNHGSTVVFNRPHHGAGPELVYNESLNSSNYAESKPQRLRAERKPRVDMRMNNTSENFMINLEDTFDSADERDE